MIGFLREVIGMNELCRLCLGMINAVEMIRIGKVPCAFIESMIREGYRMYGVFNAMSRRFACAMSDDFLIVYASEIDWQMIAYRRPLHFKFLNKLPRHVLTKCCSYIRFDISPMSIEEIFRLYQYFEIKDRPRIWNEVICRDLMPKEVNFLIDQSAIHSKDVRKLKRIQLLSNEQIAFIDYLSAKLPKSADY
jgi:hypothetical protein